MQHKKPGALLCRLVQGCSQICAALSGLCPKVSSLQPCCPSLSPARRHSSSEELPLLLASTGLGAALIVLLWINSAVLLPLSPRDAHFLPQMLLLAD